MPAAQEIPLPPADGVVSDRWPIRTLTVLSARGARGGAPRPDINPVGSVFPDFKKKFRAGAGSAEMCAGPSTAGGRPPFRLMGGPAPPLMGGPAPPLSLASHVAVVGMDMDRREAVDKSPVISVSW